MPNEVKLGRESRLVLETHKDMMKLHYKALGCHCEVMGMMSENMLSACVGQAPLYSNLHFKEVLQKWEMVNDKGEPII